MMWINMGINVDKVEEKSELQKAKDNVRYFKRLYKMWRNRALIEQENIKETKKLVRHLERQNRHLNEALQAIRDPLANGMQEPSVWDT